MTVLPAPASSASRKRSGSAREHVLINGDALMGQRVDARRLAGEGRVELVAVGQPQSLRDRGDRLRVAREIERRRYVRGRGVGGPPGAVFSQRRFELPQAFPRQALRVRLPGFPAMHGERGDAELFGEALLGQSHALADAPHGRAGMCGGLHHEPQHKSGETGLQRYSSYDRLLVSSGHKRREPTPPMAGARFRSSPVAAARRLRQRDGSQVSLWSSGSAKARPFPRRPTPQNQYRPNFRVA